MRLALNLLDLHPRRLPRLLLVGLLFLGLSTRPAGAQNQVPETHTVRPGDTLWGLARQYLGDPFLWPEIYRRNTLVVEDPHWIYPGEVLRLSGADTASAVPAEAVAPALAPAPTPTPVEAAPAQVAEANPPEAAANQMADTAAAADTEPTQVAAEEPAPAEAPLEAEPAESAPPTGTGESLFPRASTNTSVQPMVVVARAYRPLRRSEFYSSGFLSEGQALPFGRLLGPVAPSQISSSTPGTAHLFTKIAVTAPKGAAYQVGDTLMLVRVDRAIKDYGDVIVPTGMARVLDVTHDQAEGEIIAEYGPIRSGQQVLPAERFVGGGSSRAVPISDGVQGSVVALRDHQDLVQPQNVLFIDKGKREGVAAGDIFEIRRTASKREDAPDTVPEVIAVMQIVHTREHSATGRILTLSSAKILPGTPVWQVAKLPT